jgi:hypothetical protein
VSTLIAKKVNSRPSLDFTLARQARTAGIHTSLRSWSSTMCLSVCKVSNRSNVAHFRDTIHPLDHREWKIGDRPEFSAVSSIESHTITPFFVSTRLPLQEPTSEIISKPCTIKHKKIATATHEPEQSSEFQRRVEDKNIIIEKRRLSCNESRLVFDSLLPFEFRPSFSFSKSSIAKTGERFLVGVVKGA